MSKMKWITIAFLCAFAALWIVYPSVPKAYLYASVRYIYTKYLVLQTSNWHSKDTSLAVVRYGIADKDDAEMVANNATRAIKTVDEELNFKPKEKTLFIIYPDSLSLARSFGWDSDAGAMGVYYGGVIRLLSPRLWVKPKDGLTFDKAFSKYGPVLHEYVHLVVDNKTNGNYERWFTEGLAQYYEDKFLKNIDHDTIIKEPYPLSQMGIKYDYLPDQEWAYAQSFLMIKDLMDTYGKERMASFLKTLGTGMEFSAAFKKTYGITLNQFFQNFQTELKQHDLAV